MSLGTELWNSAKEWLQITMTSFIDGTVLSLCMCVCWGRVLGAKVSAVKCPLKDLGTQWPHHWALERWWLNTDVLFSSLVTELTLVSYCTSSCWVWRGANSLGFTEEQNTVQKQVVSYRQGSERSGHILWRPQSLDTPQPRASFCWAVRTREQMRKPESHMDRRRGRKRGCIHKSS